MKKEQFINLDLREQLTDDIKSKWYYKNVKSRLKINKQSVVFDDCFKFELRWMPNTFFNTPEFPDEISEGSVLVYMNNMPKWMLGEYDGIFDNEDRYSGDPEDILENILVYIGNYI